MTKLNTKLDAFTQKRIARFIEDFKKRTGTSPSLRDFEAAGIARDLIEQGVKDQFLDQFYVTLTNGTIVKTYQLRF